jgi:hypothetical protein
MEAKFVLSDIDELYFDRKQIACGAEWDISRARYRLQA